MTTFNEAVALGAMEAGQRQTWSDARARLGMPFVPLARVRRAVLKALPPPPARSEALPWGVPINLMAPASHKTILKLVSVRHEVAMSELLSRSRLRKVVAARDEAVALIYTHCPHLTLPQIGAIFDRDHTTILHSLEKLRRSPTRTVPAPYRLRKGVVQ